MSTDRQESPGYRVLCVDDDPDILHLLRKSFDAAGFEAATCGSGEAALRWIERNGLPHLAVVDIRMPGIDGLELCRQVHAYCDLPVILLTAVDDEPTVVKALDTVAEDYVLKPFRPAELMARARRVLRRIGSFAFTLAPETPVDGRLAVDFVKQVARIEGQPVPLTPTETKILHILMRSSPRTVDTGYLLRRVWPMEEVFEDTLRVHVHRVRQKIEPDPGRPRYVLTHRGLGYSFKVA
ncbi:MAG TPA: response regulator transcription factor [Thermoanaerobaculia bacterium]|nr:response regulator transcription factor [Thermoanaerobaculia bacterium]